MVIRITVQQYFGCETDPKNKGGVFRLHKIVGNLKRNLQIYQFKLREDAVAGRMIAAKIISNPFINNIIRIFVNGCKMLRSKIERCINPRFQLETPAVVQKIGEHHIQSNLIGLAVITFQVIANFKINRRYCKRRANMKLRFGHLAFINDAIARVANTVVVVFGQADERPVRKLQPVNFFSGLRTVVHHHMQQSFVSAWSCV